MAETKKTTETKAVKSSETKAAKPAAEKKTTTKAAAPKATAAKTTTKAAAPKATAKAVEAKAEVKVEAKAAAPKAETKKVEKKNDKMIKVTLVKSASGRLKNQIRTLEALGLRKTNSSNIVPDNKAIRGMIFVVKHLVKVENV